jgi:hypothetical protein
MAAPNILGTYELIRRIIQQQQGAGFCPTPNGAPGYDPYGYGSTQGGVLGRLQALDAGQSPYQEPAGQAQSVPLDPNFRQVSRAPINNRAQGATSAPPESADQVGPTNPPFGPSSALFGHPMAPRKDRDEEDDDKSEPEIGSPEWTRRLQAGVEARARERDDFTPSDPGSSGRDHCDDQRAKEEKRCEEWREDSVHPDYYFGCLKRAINRWAICNETGKIPRWPERWRPGTDAHPGDEETWRNYAR